MSRYDGLIIPRSYSEYLNKTDSATLSQMLQHLTGLWSHAVSAGDQKPVTSDAVYEALTDAATIQQALQLSGVLSGAVAAGDNKAVTSNAVYEALAEYTKKTELRHFHANSISYSEKILIVPNISNYGNYFNGLFTWSSYGSGNYFGMYQLRFAKDSITTKALINGNDIGEFEIESDNLYFYPNGKGNAIAGGGEAYNFLLS